MDRSFIKSLFYGAIAEHLIHPYPAVEGNERESVKMILDSVRRFFAVHVDSSRIDTEARIPEDVLAAMKDLGLFGMVVPPDFGGIGLSTTAYSRVIEEIGFHDASLAVVLGAHQSIGFRALLQFGTEAQKKRYLPRLATGEWIAAFALSEPGAGSDASAIGTRADLAADGETYLLNGAKSWVTNGDIADVLTVFARTSPETPGSPPGITAFFVDRAPGLRRGPRISKMGIRGASSPELFFDDVPVRSSNVLGDIGLGFKIAMEVLNAGRLSLASGCLGNCKRLIKMATERSLERQAFGRKIGDFELIKGKIAWMMSEAWALESMTYLTTGLVDAKGVDYSLESAICKTFGSETLWRIASEALQIAGGEGYMSSLPYERMLRDARVNPLFEGTNEILRLFVALKGMQAPSRSLHDVSKAMREPFKGFGLLSEFALRKARTALGREKLAHIHPLLSREKEAFEEHTAELARSVEKNLRQFGKTITEKQLVQSRMTEMAADLYALVACLSRTTREIERFGEENASLAIELTREFAESAEKRLQDHASALEKNQDDRSIEIAGQTLMNRRYPFDIMD